MRTNFAKALNVSFTEALVETFDNLEQGKSKSKMVIDEQTVAELSKKYQSLDRLIKDKAQVF